MNKSQIREIFPDHNYDLDEYSRSSVNKKPMGMSRFELLKEGHRVGKMYWDIITIVYGREKKPFVEIHTLNGIKLSFFQNKIKIIPNNQMQDNCYIRTFPDFDCINFYGDFEWKISLKELKKH